MHQPVGVDVDIDRQITHDVVTWVGLRGKCRSAQESGGDCGNCEGGTGKSHARKGSPPLSARRATAHSRAGPCRAVSATSGSATAAAPATSTAAGAAPAPETGPASGAAGAGHRGGERADRGGQRAQGRRRTRVCPDVPAGVHLRAALGDRKSTRLNSSHVAISYAV